MDILEGVNVLKCTSYFRVTGNVSANSRKPAGSQLTSSVLRFPPFAIH